MADKSPAFQFYPKDFLSDDAVALMTNEQIGAYILLLCHAWLSPSGLPSSLSSLAKLAHCTPARFERCIWDGIRGKFQQNADGLWFNGRIEAERTKQSAHNAERSESGKKGAKARWADRDGSANGSATREPMAKNGSASASAFASSEREDLAPVPDGSADWFWGEWRRLFAGRGMRLENVPPWGDVPKIVRVLQRCQDRPVLVVALERFAKLSDADRQRMGVKAWTIGYFSTALPDLLPAVSSGPCDGQCQPRCMACTKRYLDDSQRVGA